MARGRKLLERMRRTKVGWGWRDLDKVYLGYGFEKREDANHTTYRHPDFPSLRTQVPRHNALATGYASTAVELVDRLDVLRPASDKESEAGDPSELDEDN